VDVEVAKTQYDCPIASIKAMPEDLADPTVILSKALKTNQIYETLGYTPEFLSNPSIIGREGPYRVSYLPVGFRDGQGQPVTTFFFKTKQRLSPEILNMSSGGTSLECSGEDAFLFSGVQSDG
jgi:hypothetical protein